MKKIICRFLILRYHGLNHSNYWSNPCLKINFRIFSQRTRNGVFDTVVVSTATVRKNDTFSFFKLRFFQIGSLINLTFSTVMFSETVLYLIPFRKIKKCINIRSVSFEIIKLTLLPVKQEVNLKFQTFKCRL